MKRRLVMLAMACSAMTAHAHFTSDSCPEPDERTRRECGTVRAVNARDVLGQSTGVGTAVGGVSGALLGGMIGKGLAPKVIGGVAGAVAGNYAQRRMSSHTVWDVEVVLDDGSTTSVELPKKPRLRVGQSVRVRRGELVWIDHH